MFAVVKRNKRLRIIDETTGATVYTPPDFVRVPHRNAMRVLSDQLNMIGAYDITPIIHFETLWSKRVRKTRA